ncbi:type II toxin-antitoxin system MqsR family toxin [Novosphingobium sp.]|uniref:type II toxin-antitoxin system MqsR family toxin n=1 Tax=Novosphingobium sp. TaxID=1874826 RepID=UPI003D149689
MKRIAHHDLSAIQAGFAAGTGSITTKALRDAQAINYTRADICDVVLDLTKQNFVKSEPGRNNVPGNWHDTYTYQDATGLMVLYLKFAGTTIIDVTLTSFKEK